MSRAGITVRVEEAGWRTCSVDPARIRAAARLALARGLAQKKVESKCGASLTIVLANDDRLRQLNAQFCGKDSPTNVLSFPAPQGSGGYLGDVALALGVATREASAAGKRLSDHTVHLAVHGVLHLIGYDHARAREARTMEGLETVVLRELGISNPYAPAVAAE
jgi:probable rRNA maturation factor